MAWRQTLATFFHAFADSLAPAPAVAALPGAKPGLASALTTFVNFAAPFVRIVEGKGTIADDETALNAVLDAVALLDPAAAPIVALAKEAEPAAAALIGFIASGGFKIEGGYRPELSGFAGARGHIQ